MRVSTVSCCRALVLCLALATLPALAADAPPDKAVITVRLPANAELTFDDAATKATGAERHFITPALARGFVYTYTLHATWNENGKTIQLIRNIAVRPGEVTSVVISAADWADLLKAEKEPDKKEVEAKKEAAPKKDEARSRTFLFSYGATVTGLKPEQKVRIWLPVPPSNEDQDAKIESDKELPEGYKVTAGKEYGNRFLYVEAEADKDGKIPLGVTYRVTRRELKGGSREDMTTAAEIARFLEADALVPIEGKPLDLLKDKKLPSDQEAAAKVLYDVVNSHMKYDKPKDKPWGRGDSVYACEAGVGNCSDFHSLFITLARSQKIPAKFEMGFPLPEKHGAGDIPGYHCWAKFKPKGKGWVPVDISEANKNPKLKEYYFGNLTANRVAFSTGRDLTLEPKQDGPPLNYLIYPYVEVDGKPYTGDKVQRKFSYKDLEAE
jgi:uncharacterized protein (TIGR03000 family)